MRDQADTQENPSESQPGIFNHLLKLARSSINFLRQFTQQPGQEKAQRVIKKVVRCEGVPVQKPKAVVEKPREVKRIVIRIQPSVPRKKQRRPGDVYKMGFIRKMDRKIDDSIWLRQCQSTVSSSQQQVVTPPRASQQSQEQAMKNTERVQIKCDPKDTDVDKVIQSVMESMESRQPVGNMPTINQPNQASFIKPTMERQMRKQAIIQSQQRSTHKIFEKAIKTEKSVQNKVQNMIVIDDPDEVLETPKKIKPISEHKGVQRHEVESSEKQQKFERRNKQFCLSVREQKIEMRREKQQEEELEKQLEKEREKTVEKLTIKLVQIPNQNSGQKYIEKPAEKPIQKPIQKLVQKPIQNPIQRPLQKPLENPFLPTPSQQPINNPFLMPVQKSSLSLSDIIKDYRCQEPPTMPPRNDYAQMELQDNQPSCQPQYFFTPQKIHQPYENFFYTPQPQMQPQMQPVQFSTMCVQQLFGRQKTNLSLFFEQENQPVRHGRPQRKFEFGKKPKARIF